MCCFAGLCFRSNEFCLCTDFLSKITPEMLSTQQTGRLQPASTRTVPSRQLAQQRRLVCARGIGKDSELLLQCWAYQQCRHPHTLHSVAVVEGWLDIAKLVASEGTKSKSPYEEIAYKIGEQQRTAHHNTLHMLSARDLCGALPPQLLYCNAQVGMCMWTLLAGTCSCGT